MDRKRSRAHHRFARRIITRALTPRHDSLRSSRPSQTRSLVRSKEEMRHYPPGV